MLNAGLIYTTDKCIGCNKCISVCPVELANRVIKDEITGKHVMKIDETKCIACGNCIMNCGHGAREYRDDTKEFFKDLVRGEPISIIIAPSFVSNNEKEYANIIGYLKHLGVNHVYNASFGADLITWIYVSHIKKNNLEGMIASACPSVVKYIERFVPSLVEKMLPFQTPMMATAIYVRKYLKNTDKIAFFGPCISKKFEMETEQNKGMVQYNVTLKKLSEELEDIDISKYYAEDELPYGLGAIYPIPGGLTRNVENIVGFGNVINQLSGVDETYPCLKKYKEMVENKEKLPFLLDTLNCQIGCVNGAGTPKRRRADVIFEIHRLRENAFSKEKSGKKNVTPQERYEMKEKMFKDLDINDFVREFEKNNIDNEKDIEKDIEEVFESMLKVTKDDRRIDCSLCGYKTCRDMGVAISKGLNIRENCIFYAKEKLHRENEQVQNLLDKISDMNKELIKSSEMKSNFLANMSHEIRTPMNAVIGMAEMALRGDLGNREREYLNQIKSSGKGLLMIINDILDFSKIESGKIEIIEDEYNICSMIYDVISIINMRAHEKSLYLTMDVNPKIPSKLVGDDIRIRQIIINLANNAVKFTNEGGINIVVDYEEAEDDIRLIVKVRDTGIGIKKEDLKKLFVSFQQVDSKRNRNVEGTGLGLAITQRFVNLMGGEISVASEYEKGTEMSFWIPQKVVSSDYIAKVENKKLVVEEKIGDSILKENFKNIMNELEIEYNVYDEEEKGENIDYIFVDSQMYNESLKDIYKKVVVIIDMNEDVDDKDVIILQRPITCMSIVAILNNTVLKYNKTDSEEIRFIAPKAQVLIVDDNIVNLTVAQGLLEPLKMNIKTATRGKEAINMIKKEKFDIVFMDHMMPEMDGVETTKMIRELEDDYYKKIPIIALTANAVNGARKEFLEAGMNDFVAKPIELRNIIIVLRKWLPKEKIEKNLEHNQERIEEKILDIQGLDIKEGMNYLKDKKLYKKVLIDYHRDIEKKSALIKEYEESENIKSYTVEVHALKSSSKIIGATELSEMAKAMEKAGNENDIALIHEKTDELVEKYRSYISAIQPLVDENIKKDKKEEKLEESILKEYLEKIIVASNNFNFNEAEEYLEKLKEYSFEEKEEKMLDDISEGIEELEFEDVIEVINKWLEKL